MRQLDGKKRSRADFKDLNRMTCQEAREEVAALRQEIERHDYLYFVKGQPEISDTLYDKLFARLQALEEKFPELESPDSPTRRVGGKAPAVKLKRVEHAAPMLSLQSV